jgi:hypothetical protein
MTGAKMLIKYRNSDGTNTTKPTINAIVIHNHPTIEFISFI